MKSLTLILLFCCMPGYSTPVVGALKIYNCLHSSKAFTPYLNDKPLTKNALSPWSDEASMITHIGEQSLELRTPKDKLLQTHLKIKPYQYTAAVAFELFDQQKNSSSSKLISLYSPATEKTKDSTPLKIISFSHQELTLIYKSNEYLISIDHPLSLKKWDGGEFQIKGENDFMTSLKAEENEPHILLIWEPAPKKFETLLISFPKLDPPKELRDDLTFGRKRKDIPNLKTLKPRKDSQM